MKKPFKNLKGDLAIRPISAAATEIIRLLKEVISETRGLARGLGPFGLELTQK